MVGSTDRLSIPPIFYFTYRLGAWLLDIEIEVQAIELTWGWWRENIGKIGYPLVFGSVLCGWVSGVTGFILVRVGWRLHVLRRWRERQARRAEARAHKNEH